MKKVYHGSAPKGMRDIIRYMITDHGRRCNTTLTDDNPVFIGRGTAQWFLTAEGQRCSGSRKRLRVKSEGIIGTSKGFPIEKK